MIAATQKIPLDQLIDEASQIILDALADGLWWSVPHLRQRLPDALADARLDHVLNLYVATNGMDPRDYGRLLLVDEALQSLQAEERIERRSFGGKDETRLDPSQVSVPDKDAVRTTATTEVPSSRPMAERTPASASSPFDDEPAGEDGASCPNVPRRAVAPPLPVAEAQARQVGVDSFGTAEVRLVDPGLPVHPLAELFPETGPEDYLRIKEDIRANGQRVSAWVYQDELLDGRTRQMICRELGLKLAIQEWQGPGSPLDFVVSLNLHRRHLDASQRSLVAARIKPHFEEQARQRMWAGKATDPRAKLPESRPRERAAQLLNVSPRSVESASKVVKKGTPELVYAVEQGEVSVAAAAALAELPPEEQNQTLDAGKQAVKAQARDIRRRKTGHRPPAGTGSTDRRTVLKLDNAKERRQMAEMLWDFWGQQHCLAVARLWTGREARDRLTAAKRRGRSKTGQRTRQRGSPFD